MRLLSTAVLFHAASLLIAVLLPLAAYAFDYALFEDPDKDPTSLSLTDVETGINNIKTIFVKEETAVKVFDIHWTPVENGTITDNDYLYWTTSVDDIVVANGNVSLINIGRELPSELDAGIVTITKKGKHNIQVFLSVDATTMNGATVNANITASNDYESYKAGVSLIPLIIVLLLAVSTKMVELSLFSAIFIGSCMIAGNLKDGFKNVLSTYLLDAIKDEDHCYVVLFTFFLSGMVGMMEKSGGMFGFTKSISKYAKTARAGQFACYIVGCMIFFDDYANCLLAGETMRPLFDSLMISREKLSFIVDATAAPIASISPISSWVGFEVDLIQTEIDRIVVMAKEKGEEVTIKTSGLAVFLQSIKYRYYPIFMIILMFVLIYSKRDYGPMLIAERKVTIYERTDGGDGKGKASSSDASKANRPKDDIPLYAHNMLFPIVLLVALIFYLLVKTGEVPGEDQSVMDKIENSNSFTALLWGTFGTTMCTAVFYQLQWFKDGKYTFPNPLGALKKLRKRNEDVEEDDVDSCPIPLLSITDIIDSFLHGMGRIFPALIVLVLAWAVGAIMVDVGCDRLFSRWIVGGIPPEWLPTLSFLISFFMALATGTSWGTMSILFPLILVPTYTASNGDPLIFYATTAGVLSGSVAGDHISPISDTTVLSALASDCKLLNHVATQMPYAVVVILVSMLVGTIPVGFDAWPNIVGILIGSVLCAVFVYLICAPVSSPTGRYDIITQLGHKLKPKPSLEELREDTVKYFSGVAAKEPLDSTNLMKVDDNEEPNDGGKALKNDKVSGESDGSEDVEESA